MRLNGDQLSMHLAEGLSTAYLIASDEPLQVMEATDQIRRQARQEGFTERHVFHVLPGFDWCEVQLVCDNMSLFAERRLVEIRLPGGKPGTAGAKILQRLLESKSADNLIMLITGRLDATARHAKWCKTFESLAIYLQLWPITLQEMPGWIQARLAAHGLQADHEAIRLLADRVEGNLLAADQEIRKLKLLTDATQIDADIIMNAVFDNSRFNIFEFINAALMQQIDKLSHMLGNLRAEGTEAVVVLWGISRELRVLVQVALSLARQQNPDSLMKKNLGVWRNRRTMVINAARRQSVVYWQACLARCARVDRMIKGRIAGNAWDELLQLGIRIART